MVCFRITTHRLKFERPRSVAVSGSGLGVHLRDKRGVVMLASTFFAGSCVVALAASEPSVPKWISGKSGRAVIAGYIVDVVVRFGSSDGISPSLKRDFSSILLNSCPKAYQTRNASDVAS
jgi:hypothetical protein